MSCLDKIENTFDDTIETLEKYNKKFNQISVRKSTELKRDSRPYTLPFFSLSLFFLNFLATIFVIFTVFSTQPKISGCIEKVKVSNMEFGCDNFTSRSKRFARN